MGTMVRENGEVEFTTIEGEVCFNFDDPLQNFPHTALLHRVEVIGDDLIFVTRGRFAIRRVDGALCLPWAMYRIEVAS